MIGNQQADAAVAQIQYDVLDIIHGFRVDAGERFVKENIAVQLQARARISVRRRSPPERASPRVLRT